MAAPPPSRPAADAALALLVIAISALFYWQTLSLPPPRYEPLGPAAVPQGLCAIMALLALALLVRALRAGAVPSSSSSSSSLSSSEDDDSYRRRPLLAVGAFAITVLYVAALDARWLGFVPATLAYLFVLAFALGGGGLRRLPFAAGFALALTMLCHLTFTRVFYIDLP